MAFGTKKKDAPEEANDGQYLRNFRKGETMVRFLEETDEWVVYREHYNAQNRAFPCTEDRSTCPGCTSDDENVSKSSRKYAANVQVVKEKESESYVAPYKIPIGMAQGMFERSEKRGTVLDRDYLVMKNGSGIKTRYEVDPDERYAVDTAKLLKADGVDISEILQAMFDDNAPKEGEGRKKGRFNKDDDDDEPSSRRRRGSSDDDDEKPSRRRRTADDDDDEPKSSRRSRVKDDDDAEAKEREARRPHNSDEDEPPSEPEGKSESAADSGASKVEQIDEDDLYEMELADLRDLAERHNITVPDDARKSDLIKLFINAAA